ncbi:MAG: hypothetical protein KAW93_07520, partial [Methanogenium sp.]|nr:hypothetical protein [Methanogenium sp.]
MVILIVLVCVVLVIVLAVSFVPVRFTGSILMQGITKPEGEADIRWGIISFHHTGEEGEIRLINRRIFTVKPGA